MFFEDNAKRLAAFARLSAAAPAQRSPSPVWSSSSCCPSRGHQRYPPGAITGRCRYSWSATAPQPSAHGEADRRARECVAEAVR